MNEEIFVETANSAIDSLIDDIHKLQEPKTPTKEQIEKIAFELFNADFCAMTEADWDWRPERIKSQYRAMAQIAIIEWEKIRRKL